MRLTVHRIPAFGLLPIHEQPEEEAALVRAEFLTFFSALRGENAPRQRRPPLPFSAVTLLCNQLLQYSLGLAKQIGQPTKRRTTVAPPPLCLLSAGTLYQVLNAAAVAVNEIIAGGGGVEAGVVIMFGGGGGGGVPL